MSAKYGTVYLHRGSIRLNDYKNKFKKTTTTKMAKEDKANKIYEMKKTKKYHVFIASNRKIVEKEAKYIALTHIYMTAHSHGSVHAFL
jgi:hypothetical protein